MAFPPSRLGRLAQLVERTLSMREVGGSKPPLSKIIQISIVQQFKFKKEFFKRY